MFGKKQSNTVIENIKQQKYSLSFQTETVKDGVVTSLNGKVYRNNDTCYLKQERLVIIQRDSFFVSIDTVLKMAFAGKSSDMKERLAPLSYDPYNIIYCSEKYSKDSLISIEKNRESRQYFFDSNNPLKSISYTYWNSNDSLDYFKVSLVYTQRLGTVNETILYRRSEDIKTGKKPFTESDYILKKGSAVFLNHRLSNYIFSNYIK